MLRHVVSFLTYVAVAATAAMASPALHLIGDSTMANKPPALPERGWGMVLPAYFKDPAMVHNHALNGRSTKSFIDEGVWAKVVSELQAGDFLIIQFGHNDEKSEDPKRFTNPATSYRDNLRRFIQEARAKGATPILATSVARRKFEHGKLIDTHGAYPDATRAVAAEEHVPLLDLERDTSRWLQSVGDEPSKQFFMWIPKGKFAELPNGRQDNTHFVEAGAQHVAELAIAAMRELKLPLVQYLQ